MVEYTTSLSNAEMGLDNRRVVLVERRSSSERMWKVIGALFILALCFAGILLFVWYLNGKQEVLVRRRRFKKNLCTSVKDVCIRESNLFPLLLPAASLRSDRSSHRQGLLGDSR